MTSLSDRIYSLLLSSRFMVVVGCAAVADVSVLHHIALPPRRRRAPKSGEPPEYEAPDGADSGCRSIVRRRQHGCLELTANEGRKHELAARARRAAAARAHGARDGRRRQGAAPARRRPAHRARAHRRAWSTPAASTRSAPSPARPSTTTHGNLDELHAANCVMGRGHDRRPAGGRRAATTSRCAAARPTRRSRRSRSWPSRWRTSSGCRSSASSRARAAAARSRPSRRRDAPTCRAGSASPSSATSTSPTNLGDRAGRRARPRLGRRARRGAAGGQPLLGHDEGNLGDVRRRPAGGRAARPEPRQAGARRLGDPDARPAPSTTPSTPRRRRSRARAASSPICRRRSTASPPRAERERSARPARGVPVQRRPARPAQGLQDAPDHRGGRRQRLVLRDGRRCSAGRSSPGSRGSTAGRSAMMASDPYLYGGAWTADACAEDHALRRPGRDLPPAGRATSCDCPGFLIGLEAEKPATIRHGVRAMAAINQSSVPWCSIIVRNVVRRRRRRAPAGRPSVPSATPGRPASGARCRSRAASRRPTAPRSTPRPIREAKLAEIEAAARTRCARRSARRRPSGSRRSSTRATRAAAVRVRRPGRAAAHARPAFVRDAPLRQQDWRRQDQPPAALARAEDALGAGDVGLVDHLPANGEHAGLRVVGERPARSPRTRAISSARGVNTSLMTATWLGWIAILPREAVARRRARTRRAQALRVAEIDEHGVDRLRVGRRRREQAQVARQAKGRGPGAAVVLAVGCARRSPPRGPPRPRSAPSSRVLEPT